MRPLIGVTPYFKDTPDRQNSCYAGFISPESSVTYVYYTRKVEEAGGVPVTIPYFNDGDALPKILSDRLDGILFTGGEDIDPKYYDELPAGSEASVRERDAQEIKLFDAFYSERKPIFAICRGVQLMNVFFHGSLIQDISSEGKGYLNHALQSEGGGFSVVHDVSVEKGTLLASLVGENAKVNSMHHQATRKVGEGLIVTAVSEDGVIEGLEHPDYPFMLGVQWHPERLNEEPHLNLFRAFVESAKSI
jgi:putative glutamine amidotransferase